ncbi:DNA-nicking Smr family endonuclease [Hydromonas duriensis]|uniref:DNA-nicking Smr family endonuclease n=2 Tax=Hydromonas duriensis TaxID=1527608 RepID=A0A4R6YC48_9BURK|nr:DNA-nicking Smr family endonuclease [Hydromonas duriensis]
MKAKSYGLTDLNALQKALKQEAKQREAEQLAQKAQAAAQSRMENEFKTAVKQVTPLKDKQRYIHPAPEFKLPDIKRVAPQKKQAKDKLSDGFDAQHLLNDEMGTYLRKGVPEALLRKLQRGDWVIDLRMDLHGQTSEEARIATNAFLYRAINEGARVISIIHGQGFGSKTGHAVLKQNVRNWLVQNNNVLAFCPAPAAMGGHGAVLVLLHRHESATASS